MHQMVRNTLDSRQRCFMLLIIVFIAEIDAIVLTSSSYVAKKTINSCNTKRPASLLCTNIEDFRKSNVGQATSNREEL